MLNFYDNIELIESELLKHSIWFFDIEDIMNYLIDKKYHFYGEYVTKNKKQYGHVCHDAVRKFFEFDIKLDSDENNEDMARLRQMIARHYQGLNIPPLNRTRQPA